MPNISFKATIKRGRIVPKKAQEYYSHLNSLEDKDIEVIVRKWRSKRTVRQNNYYWFYLNLLEEYTGIPSKVLHNQFKEKFLPTNIEEGLKGQSVKIKPSTTNLTRDEFTKYLKRIEALTEYALPRTDEYDQLINENL